MAIINSANEVNTLAAKESDTGGVYFVTAFSGLLAPYWDPGAAGMLIGPSRSFIPSIHISTALIGISQYTNPSHIARATLEANAFQTRAIIESMKLDSGSDLKQLKVDGGMTNGDLTMSILADIGGFNVIRPEMREYVSYLLFHLFLEASQSCLCVSHSQVYSSWFGYLCWSCYQTFWMGLEES